MSKKSFSTAGMDILGLRQPEERKAERDPAWPLPKGPTTPPTNTPAAGGPEQGSAENNAQQLVRKSYYVWPSQHKALKIKAANGEEEKDISAIIRNAIDLYLAHKA